MADPKGIAVYAGKGRPSTSTGGAPIRHSCGRTARSPISFWMTGATRPCWCTRGRIRKGRHGAGIRPRQRPRRVGRHPHAAATGADEAPGALDQSGGKAPRCLGRDHHRSAPALRDDAGRHAALPRDRRQQLGDEVEVRQPAMATVIRSPTGSSNLRRDARRQGRRDLRLWRCRRGCAQSLRGEAPRS